MELEGWRKGPLIATSRKPRARRTTRFSRLPRCCGPGGRVTPTPSCSASPTGEGLGRNAVRDDPTG